MVVAAASRSNGRGWSADRDVDWSTLGSLPRQRQETAWRIASQGVVTEEAGLITAARLAALVEERGTRRLLAIQTADEAKHSEAFEAYAIKLGGSIDPAGQRTTALVECLASVEDPLRLFAIHTFLEACALDQFKYLERAFDADPLAQIFRFVRRDESRHVRMGIEHLRRTTEKMPSDHVKDLSDWCAREIHRFAAVDCRSIGVWAQLSGAEAPDVAAAFSACLERRRRQAFSIC